MILLILSCIGFQTNLQAKWSEDAYAYYCVAHWIISEKIELCKKKINKYNPWAKAEVIKPEPEAKPYRYKFIKYRRIYDKHGHRIIRSCVRRK